MARCTGIFVILAILGVASAHVWVDKGHPGVVHKKSSAYPQVPKSVTPADINDSGLAQTSKTTYCNKNQMKKSGNSEEFDGALCKLAVSSQYDEKKVASEDNDYQTVSFQVNPTVTINNNNCENFKHIRFHAFLYGDPDYDSSSDGNSPVYDWDMVEIMKQPNNVHGSLVCQPKESLSGADVVRPRADQIKTNGYGFQPCYDTSVTISCFGNGLTLYYHPLRALFVHSSVDERVSGLSFSARDDAAYHTLGGGDFVQLTQVNFPASD